MKNVLFKILLFCIVALLFGGCADVMDIDECVKNVEPAGFWWGLWNGVTVAFSFIGSLFDNNIAIYTVHNNGAFYNLGFVIGANAMLGGITITSKK